MLSNRPHERKEKKENKKRNLLRYYTSFVKWKLNKIASNDMKSSRCMAGKNLMTKNTCMRACPSLLYRDHAIREIRKNKSCVLNRNFDKFILSFWRQLKIFYIVSFSIVSSTRTRACLCVCWSHECTFFSCLKHFCRYLLNLSNWFDFIECWLL